MTPSASFDARPGRASVADALARTLLDITTCPSCDATLSGARCAGCGVDLSGEAGGRIWALGQQAVLTLREREHIVAGVRAEGPAPPPAAPPQARPPPAGPP